MKHCGVSQETEGYLPTLKDLKGVHLWGLTQEGQLSNVTATQLDPASSSWTSAYPVALAVFKAR